MDRAFTAAIWTGIKTDDGRAVDSIGGVLSSLDTVGGWRAQLRRRVVLGDARGRPGSTTVPRCEALDALAKCLSARYADADAPFDADADARAAQGVRVAFPKNTPWPS